MPATYWSLPMGIAIFIVHYVQGIGKCVQLHPMPNAVKPVCLLFWKHSLPADCPLLVAELFRSPSCRYGMTDISRIIDHISSPPQDTSVQEVFFWLAYLLDINWLSPVDLAVVPLLRPSFDWLIDWLTDRVKSHSEIQIWFGIRQIMLQNC